jgi:hypothetical protein
VRGAGDVMDFEAKAMDLVENLTARPANGFAIRLVLGVDSNGALKEVATALADAYRAGAEATRNAARDAAHKEAEDNWINALNCPGDEESTERFIAAHGCAARLMATIAALPVEPTHEAKKGDDDGE